jgi:carboxyl-terminal processing protease
MDEDEFKEFEVLTKGEFGGVGIEITIKDKLLTVIAPIEDTPAYRAGVRAGDIIIKIDDRSTWGMSLKEVVKILRGKPKTKVKLMISREGVKKAIDITIARDIIHIKSVKHEMVSPKIGYLHILQFPEGTTEEAKKVLKKFSGKVEGLIIDLRNDPGGLLPEAIGVADLFIKDGVIVSTKGRLKAQDKVYYAHNGGIEPTYSIIVLINGGSASASEILAGCLQDHKRAIIMGTKSFGKGSVQTIFPMDDGSAISLTTAEYYTPSNRCIQALGITPDVYVPQGKLKIEEGEMLREENLPRHLKALEKEETKTEKVEDYQLSRAIGLLKAIEIVKHR